MPKHDKQAKHAKSETKTAKPEHVKQLTKEQKSEFHKNDFDPKWQFADPFDPTAQQKTRECLYQIMGAVLHGQPLNSKDPNSKKFGIDGILNPRDGNHHFSKLPQEYLPIVKQLLHYLVFARHKGNVTRLGAELIKWSGDLKTEIDKVSLQDPKRNEKIAQIIDQNKLVRLVRDNINLKEVQQPKKTHDEDFTVKMRTAAEVDAPLPDVEKDATEPEAETEYEPEVEVETDEEKEKKEHPQTAKELEKLRNFNSAKTTYIDALYYDIIGNNKKSAKKYREAEDRGYFENIETEVSLSERNNIRNSNYLNTYFFYLSKSPKLAEEYHQRSLARNVPLAQYYQALLYHVNREESKALEFLRKSADQGFAEAQFNLGIVYELGNGVDKNPTEAFRFYKLAADQGNSRAQFSLGNLYKDGNGVSKNMAEAVRFYRLAANEGLDKAQCVLGIFYHEGNDIPKDITEAVRLYKLSADQGYAEGQYNLGTCYDYGNGVDKDPTKAFRLYKLAADQGFKNAQYNLGLCYENGYGIAKDHKEAVRLIKLSADQGFRDAQYNMGVFYENGDGVPQDAEEAARYYKLAADQNYKEAQNLLAIAYFRGSGVEKNQAEAFRLWELSAKQGYVEAQSNLATAHLKTNNFSEAFKWCKLAAENGHSGAQTTLGTLYEEGLGTNKDLKEALRLYKLSSDQKNPTGIENFRRMIEEQKRSKLETKEPEKPVTKTASAKEEKPLTEAEFTANITKLQALLDLQNKIPEDLENMKRIYSQCRTHKGKDASSIKVLKDVVALFSVKNPTSAAKIAANENPSVTPTSPTGTKIVNNDRITAIKS